MRTFLVLLSLFALPSAIVAVPLYDGGGGVEAVSESSTFRLLAVALSLLPFPLLAAAKYAYLRFRRGQSIHTQHEACRSELVCSQNPSAALSQDPSPSAFWLTLLDPYLVGILGSPEWETIIFCRIHKTLRRVNQQCSPSRGSLSPLLASSSRSRRTVNTSIFYSSLSTKSRGTSYSKHRSVTLVEKSISTISDDFATLRPPLLRIPPAAHVSSSVRFSPPQMSPTLMQIMQPILSSSFDDQQLPRLRVNDKSISSVSGTSLDNSASTGDPSIPFYTPDTSLGSFPSASASAPMPFSILRKQHTISAASSMLSISAVSLPSPASVSFAVFHSPLAPSIPVPRPVYVYSPSLRPESCVALPHDWQPERENIDHQALFHSPTHRSPNPDAPSIFDCLPIIKSAETNSLSTRPLNVNKAFADVAARSSPSTLLPKLHQGSAKFPTIQMSPRHLAVATTPKPFCVSAIQDPSTSEPPIKLQCPGEEPGYKASWTLADLNDPDGKLDVDAVSRALGIGLGLAFSASVSRQSICSAVSRSESEAAVSAMLTLSPVQEDDDKAITASPANSDASVASPNTTPFGCSGTFGWGTQDQQYNQDGRCGLAGLNFYMHVHGRPLCVIPEETRSEVGSIVLESDAGMGSGTADETEMSGVVTIELDSGIAEYETMKNITGCEDTMNSRSPVKGLGRASGDWDESWREGESIGRLSTVGVAW